MTQSRWYIGALLGVVALTAACDQAKEPLGPNTPPQAMLQQLPGGENPDQHALGQAIPAFGGLFLDQGVPTVYLTDPSAHAAVEHAIGGFLTARGAAASELRVRQARFSYATLERFYDRVKPQAFAGPGTVFTDLDEAHNRVLIGVQDAAAADRLHSWVQSLGLPDGAVAIERAAPIYALATLRDVFNPIPAGVQIHFGNYLCSIGIIAQVNGSDHFVTASHCTNTQGGVEGTQYYQPLSSTDGTVIGVEVADPDYVSWRQGDCPYRGVKCRHSDAALIRSTGARPFAQGKIAQTSSGITWSGNYFDVTGKGSGMGVVGDARSKVGRTTGYTSGTITNSCVDTGVSGSNIVQLCQDFVEGSGTIVGGGDSGSDVFKGSGSVTWWGILWGGSSDGSMFVYSPASNVESELGTLDVVGSGGGGGVVAAAAARLTASFTYSCHFNDCSFDASSSTGASTYSWNFGDGAPAGSGVTASHSYGSDGSFDVVLTVGDGSTTDTAQQTISCATHGPHRQCK